MIVSHYEHPELNYYSGFEAGYLNDDFIYQKVTVRKVFRIKDINYTIWYNPGTRIIYIKKHQDGNNFVQTLSTLSIDLFGFIENVCDAIKAFDVCKS